MTLLRSSSCAQSRASSPFGFRPNARFTSRGDAAKGDAKWAVTTRSKAQDLVKSSTQAAVSSGARMYLHPLDENTAAEVSQLVSQVRQAAGQSIVVA